MGDTMKVGLAATALLLLLQVAASTNDEPEVFPTPEEELYELVQETAQESQQAQQKAWGEGLQAELAKVAQGFGHKSPDQSILKMEKGLMNVNPSSASPLAMNLNAVTEVVPNNKLKAAPSPMPESGTKNEGHPENLADAWHLIDEQKATIRRLKQQLKQHGSKAPAKTASAGAPIQLIGDSKAVLDVCSLPKTLVLKGAESDPHAKAAETNMRFALREARSQIQCGKKMTASQKQRQQQLKKKAQQHRKKAAKKHAQEENMLKSAFGMLAKAEGARGAMRPTVLDAKKMNERVKKETQQERQHMLSAVAATAVTVPAEAEATAVSP